MSHEDKLFAIRDGIIEWGKTRAQSADDPNPAYTQGVEDAAREFTGRLLMSRYLELEEQANNVDDGDGWERTYTSPSGSDLAVHIIADGQLEECKDLLRVAHRIFTRAFLDEHQVPYDSIFRSHPVAVKLDRIVLAPGHKVLPENCDLLLDFVDQMGTSGMQAIIRDCRKWEDEAEYGVDDAILEQQVTYLGKAIEYLDSVQQAN